MQSPLQFSIKNICDWTENSEVAIPALQRGLVWNPSQIELLWDSLMRGIPIGSFVVCKYIASQDNSENRNTKYHLLDGQQRVNAVQLACDNFAAPQNRKKSILWLDLSTEGIPQASSRNFLFRLTTPAHPWGYNSTDSADRLSAHEIRSWLWENGRYDTGSKEYVRPMPSDIQPISAQYPIPFSILLASFEKNGNEITSDSLLNDLEKYKNHQWAQKAMLALQNKAIDLQKINGGLKIVSDSVVLALQAPDELMTASEQENKNGDIDDITNIEHLFQRLNRQGTELKGEELVYSMIKAYWPEIAVGIDSIETKLMPASRLVSLAFRVILTEENISEEIRFAPDQGYVTFFL